MKKRQKAKINNQPRGHIIYGSSVHNIERAYKLLDEKKINSKNKEVIKEWVIYLKSTNTGERRIGKLIGQIRNLCEHLNCDFEKVNKLVLQKAINAINESGISISTKTDYIRLCKQFFKWYKKQDARLESISQAEIIQLTISKNKDAGLDKIRQHEKQRSEAIALYDYIDELKRGSQMKDIDAAQVLTESEIQLLVNKGCCSIKGKALISMLFETGCRIGELLCIKLFDLSEVSKQGYIKVRVDGKTGKRTVYCYKSLRYLLQLKEDNQYNTKDAYLFYNKQSKDYPMSYQVARKLIRKAFEIAEIAKLAQAHWFRHSRASGLVNNNMQESKQRMFMGWTADSRMLKTYIHLKDADVEDEFNRLHDLKSDKKKQEQPISCSFCRIMNDSSSDYCSQCHRPLKVEVALSGQEAYKAELANTVKALMEVMQNPKKKKLFDEFLKVEDKQET